MEGRGFEHTHDFPKNSADLQHGGAQSDARCARDGNSKDNSSNSTPSSAADLEPALFRFWAAWDRLSDADRLRLIQEAEKLADLC